MTQSTITYRSEATQKKRFTGGCHCGAVRYEVRLDLSEGVTRCNCTICSKLGRSNMLVKPDAFRLVAGAENLAKYLWGGKIGEYLFCKTCGVHAFSRGHLEQLGGAFVSVNVNCVDDVDVSTLDCKYWDGRHNNWAAGPRSQPWPIA